MTPVYFIDWCLFLLFFSSLALSMAARYALRVDVVEGLKDKLSEWLSSVATGFIVARELEGDNDHVHCIIDSTKSIKQLRNSFTKKFPECTGNKGYSMKVCDDDHDAYIRYICKGKDKDTPPEIWTRQGLDYTEAALQEAWKKYWVNNAALKENAKKRTRVETANIVEQVEKESKRLELKGFDREGVAKVYIRLFRDARKGINVFAARAVVNTVCCLLDGSGEDHLAQKIAEL